MHRDTSLSKRHALMLCLLLPLTAAAATADDYAYRYPLQTAGSSPAWRVELTPAGRRDAQIHDLGRDGRQVRAPRGVAEGGCS